MKWLKFFLAAHFVLPSAGAGENQILIRAADSDQIQYQAHLLAYPDATSYSQWWIRQRVPENAKAELKNLLLQAQNEFLKGGVVNAREKFLDIIKLAQNQDWRSAERATFVYAHLRSAQLATDQDSKEQQLQLAAGWGQVDLQENLFPKPLWKDYQLLKKSNLSEAIDLDLWFPDARYLLIDGRPVEILAGAKVEIDKLRHRFTLVYDHASPETKAGTWNELKAWRPNPKPFASGSCEKPNWNKDPNLPRFMVFYKANCIFPWGNAILAGKGEFKPIAANPDWSQPAHLNSQTKISKWFWAAAGAVVFAAIALNQEHDKKTQANTTIGF